MTHTRNNFLKIISRQIARTDCAQRVWASRHYEQMKKTLVEEDKIVATIRQIPSRSFTVLDFSEVFKTLYPADWQRLVARFGQLGEKRRYTVTTYLSNRLDVYSRKSDSLLQPITRYSAATFKDYRRPSAEERRRFGSPWIAVFKKKERKRP